MAPTSIHRSPILIVHGIYLNKYNGSLDGFYPGGFKWAAENGWGGEVYNFRPVAGRCYGHVEVLDHSIHIEKLGASREDQSIDGVLVVWTAPDPSSRRGRLVVGWYKNATVYRDRQQPEGVLKRARTYPQNAEDSQILSYQVEAAEGDCKLLSPEERVLWIPPRKSGDKGIPGQSPVYFPECQTAPVGPEIARCIRHFINNGEPLSIADVLGAKPRKSHGRQQPDPERRKEIEEAAMKIVCDHFGKLKYNVQPVPELNLGYDIVATRGDTTLCIEVKGRSVTTISADFTFNEFDKIKLEQERKFTDGSYRICIVTGDCPEFCVWP